MKTVRLVDCSAEPTVQGYEMFMIRAHVNAPSTLTLFSSHGFFVGQHNGVPTNRASVASDSEMWVPFLCA